MSFSVFPEPVAPAPGFEHISTVALTTGATATFSSIDSKYKDLRLTFRATMDSNTFAFLRFNGISTNTYSNMGNGQTAAATLNWVSPNVNTDNIRLCITGSAGNIAGSVDIRDAGLAGLTSVLGWGHTSATTDSAAQIFGTFNSTSPVTSVSFIINSGNFTAGSLSLYGSE